VAGLTLDVVKATFGSTDVRHEAALAETPLITSARPPLTQVIGLLQVAREPLDYYRLQSQVRRQLFAAQSVAAEIGETIEAVNQQLKIAVGACDGSRAEIQHLQGQLAAHKLAERGCKALMHAFRVVADGIAWKTLRYDRAGIAVLGSGKRVGRLTDPEGLDMELREIASHWWMRGSFAIHNDLTNCLNTGDLTLPFEGERHVVVQEVKAGRSTRRAQTSAAERRIEFLQSGSGDDPTGCGPARMQRYAIPYRTHLSELRALIAGARARGYAHAQLSDAVLAVAVDPRVSQGDPGIDTYCSHAQDQVGWGGERDHLITNLSMIRRVTDRRYSFASLAPWSIFPLPAHDIADLLLGPVEYLTFINAKRLEEAFSRHGIEAEVTLGSARIGSVFLRASRGTSEVTLPSLVRDQVMTELMTVDCLIEAVEAMLDSIDADGAVGQTLVAFAGEDQVWA